MAGETRWHLIPDYLRRRVISLKIRLGGRCSGVGCDEDNLDKLEFHHVYGKAWRSNEFGPSQRIKKYEQEAAEGLVVLLCRGCHRFSGCHPDICFCPFCRGESDF